MEILILFTAPLALFVALVVQRHRRRDAEERLRASEARCRNIVEHNSAILRALPDLMFELSRDGTYVSYHARDPSLLFIPPELFVGKRIADILPHDCAQKVMKAIEQTCVSRESVVVEYDLQVGEPRHFEARLVPYAEDHVLSIVRDVTETTRAHELNRKLARRLIASQEEERQRIARELHDDLGQKIALLSIDVDQMARQLPTAEQRMRMRLIFAQVTDIAKDLHDLSHELHPARLQMLGLLDGLRVLCREMSDQWHFTVAFDAQDLTAEVDPNIALCMYRVTQEALYNVARHSRAQHVSVTLNREGDQLSLQIADAGVGFEPNAVQRSGLGLVSMKERVGMLNGTFAIHSTPGTGTRIDVRIPLVDVVEEEAPAAVRHDASAVL